jgi:hypothetical protein
MFDQVEEGFTVTAEEILGRLNSALLEPGSDERARRRLDLRMKNARELERKTVRTHTMFTAQLAQLFHLH